MQILHYLLHCVYGVGVAHENFSPVLDFKERFQQLRWIGHGCDSDAQLATLYEYWLVNHSSELFDPATSRSAFIPPPRMHVYFDFVIIISLLKILEFFTTFLPRDALLSAVYAVVVCLSVCVCVCVCVCVSVTLRYCIKTAKHRITQITPHDSPLTLVF